MNSFPRYALMFVCLACLTSGCALQELQSLRDQVEQLRAENEDLYRQLAEADDGSAPPPPDLVGVPSFTVGLAASQKDFDESAFVSLLEKGLSKGSDGGKYNVFRENDSREIDKIRGMLLHQYLAAEEIPITISNLTYKVRSPDNDFIIGDRAVPRSGVQITNASGGAAHVTHKDAISAVMRRDGQGNYSINYEERGGGNGAVRLDIRDVEIIDPEQRPRSARQGDIAFNWHLNLEQLQVYRVEGFKGDVGRFLRTMRYPGPESRTISQYQTLRDYVFMFGYGNYFTGLVNQITTPRHITEVEVLAIDSGAFDKLEGGLDETQILEIVGRGTQWIPCEFVKFENDTKVWSRPAAVSFPFLSRQVRGDKNLIFYNKYDAAGQQILIGDFDRTQ